MRETWVFLVWLLLVSQQSWFWERSVEVFQGEISSWGLGLKSVVATVIAVAVTTVAVAVSTVAVVIAVGVVAVIGTTVAKIITVRTVAVTTVAIAVTSIAVVFTVAVVAVTSVADVTAVGLATIVGVRSARADVGLLGVRRSAVGFDWGSAVRSGWRVALGTVAAVRFAAGVAVIVGLGAVRSTTV